jgi:uncharacterized protein (DUF58 family)
MRGSGIASERRSNAELVSSDLLGRIDRLRFVSGRSDGGMGKGGRKSRHRGSSAEFSDHRPYEAGDDLRYVDWNLFGRMDRLYLKLFVDERDLAVHLLLDSSGSMDFGRPSKLHYALRLAAALGYIGLVGLERVKIGLMQSRVASERRVARGRSQFLSLVRFLEEVAPQGVTDLNGALRDYARRTTEPGVAIILSDLLDPRGFDQGVSALLERRFDVHVIHIVSEEDCEPAPLGQACLVDAESGETREIMAEGETLREYLRRFHAFLDGAEACCRKRRISYYRVRTTEPLEKFLLIRLKGGLLE